MIHVLLDGIPVYTGNLMVENIITSAPDTAFWEMVDPGREPLAGQDVRIYRDTEADVLFGGVITEVTKTTAQPNRIAANRRYRYEVTAIDHQRFLNRWLVAAGYDDMTCAGIIRDIVRSFVDPAFRFTTANVEDGPVIDRVSFSYVKAADAIAQIARLVGYEWYVDADRDIHFFNRETRPAPFPIDDDAVTSRIRAFSLRPDYSQVKNRIVIRGGIQLSDPYTEEFVADGERRVFPLAWKPHNISEILVGGTVKSFAIDYLNDDDGTFEYLWSYNEKYIRAGEGGPEPTPAAGTVISVTYQYEIPILVRRDNEASQAAIAALEGGSGIYEDVISDETIESRAMAVSRADAELAEYGNAMIRGSFVTLDHGFRAGQYVSLDVPGYEAYAGNYQIKRVAMRAIGPSEVQYTVEFATSLYELTDFLMSIVRDKKKLTLREADVIDVLHVIEETIMPVDGVPETTILTHPRMYDDGSAYDILTWG